MVAMVNDPLNIRVEDDLCCRHLHGVDMGGNDMRLMESGQTGFWFLAAPSVVSVFRGPDPLPGKVS
jgi:hypothetical protein